MNEMSTFAHVSFGRIEIEMNFQVGKDKPVLTRRQGSKFPKREDDVQRTAGREGEEGGDVFIKGRSEFDPGIVFLMI